MTDNTAMRRSQTDRADLAKLVLFLAAMSPERVERWMARNGYTGMAAFALNKKVRALRAKVS